MNDTKNPYTGYRYPAEIISHAVWMYFRITLEAVHKGCSFLSMMELEAI